MKLLLILVVLTFLAGYTESKPGCRDRLDRWQCRTMKRLGLCSRVDLMKVVCKKTCRLCGVKTDGPITDYPTDGPYTEYPTDGPYTDYPTDGPYTDYPTDGPYTDYPTDGPYTDYPTDEPYTDYPTDEPYTDYPTDEPYTDYPTDSPGNMTDYPTDGPYTDYPTDAPENATTFSPRNFTEGPTPAPGACGKVMINEQRVIAGVNAKEGRWPWQILMLMGGSPGCGGSIIGPRHVVTAAHCVDGYEGWPSYFSVRVGEFDRETKSGHEAEYRVKRVFKHHKYNNPSAINNDIAMFELERPILFNKYVQPICLPKADPPVGTQCYITGWGKMKHPGNMVRYLQQAEMPVVDNKVCNKKNKASIGIPVTDAMICSGDGGESRRSGCHGDSGGPFVCNIGGRWELHGAVSHGSSRCASTESYTVYARVNHFKNWILKNMRA